MPLDLFNWKNQAGATVTPWCPHPLRNDQWPPNYQSVHAWRIQSVRKMRADPVKLWAAKQYYSKRPVQFILDWCDTYDPRKQQTKWMPFVFFMKQVDVVEFFQDLRTSSESGLIEKCRDAGATWLACAYSVWSFLFIKHDAIGWGSRKANLVDKLGDPDSIFEKMRLILRRLPKEFLPNGWNEQKHAIYMKFVNPENGATITGEAGDNIGRGGRKSVYFVDEAAHLERPEKVEAALGDNTNVRIEISSVNGLGNPFHRRRQAGIEWTKGKVMPPGFTRVLTIDWRDHPEKNQEWYDKRKAKYEREGLMHLFAQEVDRDYSAAISNTIVPKAWIMDCIDAHIKLGFAPGGVHCAGLDVADGGIDRNALTIREGVVCRFVDEWGERDPGVSTRKTVVALRGLQRCRVMYDSIGVGSSVKSEYNRLVDEKLIDPMLFPFVAWNAGAGVIDPRYRVIPDDLQSITNEDMFHNLKAQAWWSLRIRVWKTWRMVNGEAVYPHDELISLDSTMPLLYKLIDELAQPVKKDNTASLKMIVDKQPEGMKSPNLADSCVMAYFPIEDRNFALVGNYGT